MAAKIGKARETARNYTETKEKFKFKAITKHCVLSRWIC